MNEEWLAYFDVTPLFADLEDLPGPLFVPQDADESARVEHAPPDSENDSLRSIGRNGYAIMLLLTRAFQLLNFPTSGPIPRSVARWPLVLTDAINSCLLRLLVEHNPLQVGQYVSMTICATKNDVIKYLLAKPSQWCQMHAITTVVFTGNTVLPSRESYRYISFYTKKIEDGFIVFLRSHSLESSDRGPPEAMVRLYK